MGRGLWDGDHLHEPADASIVGPLDAPYAWAKRAPDAAQGLLQATREYIELAEAMPIQIREWTSGDGVESMFKVLTIAAPKIKARQGEETGIVHATGA